MKERICELPSCRKTFQPKSSSQLYCIPEHQIQHYHEQQAERSKMKAAIIKNIDGMRSRNTLTAKLNRWYELMKIEKASCTLCGRTTEENLHKYNTPLHMEINDSSIRDYRLIEPRSWNFFCTECYGKVLYDRKEEELLEKNRTNK